MTHHPARIAVLVMAAVPALADAQVRFDVGPEETGSAVVIRQAPPGYPGDSVRQGQEGWVRMSYLITADGRAVDPIILNSSGGIAFEDEARRVLPDWRFQPDEVESPYNIVNIRSETADGANAEAMERTASMAREMERKLDCDKGEPLWHYAPLRRTFSFADADGNVERFEARCEGQRIRGNFEPGKIWTLAPEWGSCRVMVFGDDGATFDFLEHPHNAEESAVGRTAVARNHVLDRRSRSR